MLKNLTCIICPNGCDLTLDIQDGQVMKIGGATCPRGEEYARQEVLAPRRTIASSVAVTGGTMPLASVRLDGPIPKEKIFDVMACIKSLRLEVPVEPGQILLENILGLGSNVIATRRVPKG